MGNILVKVHESYRMVVAVCDSDVFGRKLAQGERVIDISGGFFDGEVLSVTEAKDKILWCLGEDATFNFVGKESVDLAKEVGIVKEEGVMEVEGVPVALVLL